MLAIFEKLKTSSGLIKSSEAIFIATASTIIASNALKSSPLSLFAVMTPIWAPMTDEIIRTRARTASRANVVVAWSIVTKAVMNMIWNKEVFSILRFLRRVFFDFFVYPIPIEDCLKY